MSWWSNADTEPKRKNKFYVEMGTGGILYSVSSVSKPAVTIETKEYQMINHFYKYPGIPKWENISIKFVDAGLWGSGQAVVAGKPMESNPRSTSKTLWEMLLASGYVTPNEVQSGIASLAKVVSPEKAAMIDLSFGSSPNKANRSSLKIHQVNGAGEKTETWTIYNPIISKISWGDLDYGQDELVEYTLDVAYDWAQLDEKD
tara:strand:+ start:248 stop:853 length:606 start_codon:yes stop_codon:yes gene_type:complete